MTNDEAQRRRWSFYEVVSFILYYCSDIVRLVLTARFGLRHRRTAEKTFS